MTLHQLSAVDIVAKLSTGELTASELFQYQQARIAKLNGQYNTFVYVADPSQPIDTTRLLKGLPISIKDQIHVAGMPCTSGYEKLRNFIPTKDAPVVAALKQAGAQILGKTNLPPLAMDFQTYNTLHGRTNNPWNPEFTAGGSSGGGAAAVAARLTYLEIGADLGGSLRLPASFCGVCSLMPSVGRVSTHGTMTLLEQANIQLDYLPRVGPIARQVEDLALAWQALSGETPLSLSRDRTSTRIAIAPVHKDLPLHPQIQATLSILQQKLESSAQVKTEVAAPSNFDWHQAWQAYGMIQGHQIGAMLNPFQRLISQLMSRGAMRRSPTFIQPIQAGYQRQARKYRQALEIRQQLATVLDAFLNHYDAWILPVTLVPAFKHIEASSEHDFVRDYDYSFDIGGDRLNYFEALTRLTTPFNLTGHPVVTIPVRRDNRSGVPIGVQLIGKRNGDRELLATAALLQQLIDPKMELW
ncbi:amidase [Vacuolonema iberomarrocanum]|uniref:amidase n=1 Tax=Vacuolonema iberomarrocanum TaxID=3454632 RepID=UPI0019FAB8E8|nr:amidase [filamentous cyanobacterium LEGE 07170]